MIVNLADMVDPKDPEGRTYREVNRAMNHAIPVGALVELESGARLFVAEHGRDCDQTPLYTLSPINPVTDPEPNELIFRSRLIGGYGIASLTIIKIPSQEDAPTTSPDLADRLRWFATNVQSDSPVVASMQRITVEAADAIERLCGTSDCDHPQINKATERWNICPDCGQTWPRGLTG